MACGTAPNIEACGKASGERTFAFVNREMLGAAQNPAIDMPMGIPSCPPFWPSKKGGVVTRKKPAPPLSCVGLPVEPTKPLRRARPVRSPRVQGVPTSVAAGQAGFRNPVAQPHHERGGPHGHGGLPAWGLPAPAARMAYKPASTAPGSLPPSTILAGSSSISFTLYRKLTLSLPSTMR